MNQPAVPIIYRFSTFTWIGCAVLGVVTVIGIVWTVGVMLSDSARELTPFAIAFWVVVAWGWYVILAQTSYEVREWPDGRVAFRSVLRERSTTIGAISAVRKTYRRFLLVEFDGKSTRLPPVEPMLDFARRVRARNPAAVVQDV